MKCMFTTLIMKQQDNQLKISENLRERSNKCFNSITLSKFSSNTCGNYLKKTLILPERQRN